MSSVSEHLQKHFVAIRVTVTDWLKYYKNVPKNVRFSIYFPVVARAHAMSFEFTVTVILHRTTKGTEAKADVSTSLFIDLLQASADKEMTLRWGMDTLASRELAL